MGGSALNLVLYIHKFSKFGYVIQILYLIVPSELAIGANIFATAIN